MLIKSDSRPDWLNSGESDGGLRCSTRALMVSVLPSEEYVPKIIWSASSVLAERDHGGAGKARRNGQAGGFEGVQALLAGEQVVSAAVQSLDWSARPDLRSAIRARRPLRYPQTEMSERSGSGARRQAEPASLADWTTHSARTVARTVRGRQRPIIKAL